ncbi:polysaccharide deacetylase family protein [Oscillospiraceae bacterium PP1C4]
MKAFITTILTLALVLTMTACTPSGKGTVSSSTAPSAAPPPPSKPASSAASTPSAVSALESAASKAASKIQSAVTTTMSTDFDKIGALGGNQIKWGPGTRVNEQNRTVDSEGLQEKYGKYSTYFIAPEDCNKLYLTFDEGYENGYTSAILDVLKEKNASAVFFVTLQFVKSQPDLVHRMIDEGHIIGNHTNHHWNPTKVSIEEAHQDILDLHEYMVKNFDYQMSLYRPPEGAFSEKTLSLAQSMGYTTVLWSFAYKDWNPKDQPGHDAALAITTKYIHEGAVYLLHAVSKDNAEVLGELIDAVRAKDLEIATWDLPYLPAE